MGIVIRQLGQADYRVTTGIINGGPGRQIELGSIVVEESEGTLPAAVQIKGNKPGVLQLDIIRNPANQPGSLKRVRWWVASNTLYRATASPSNQYPPATQWPC